MSSCGGTSSLHDVLVRTFVDEDRVLRDSTVMKVEAGLDTGAGYRRGTKLHQEVSLWDTTS